MVRGLPRPRAALQRDDGYADPTDRGPSGSARRFELPDVPQHRESKKQHGSGRFRARVPEAARLGGQPESADAGLARFYGAIESRTASPRLSEAIYARAGAGILLWLPQGPP